jgi:hypothetical protein
MTRAEANAQRSTLNVQRPLGESRPRHRRRFRPFADSLDELPAAGNTETHGVGLRRIWHYHHQRCVFPLALGRSLDGFGSVVLLCHVSHVVSDPIREARTTVSSSLSRMWSRRRPGCPSKIVRDNRLRSEDYAMSNRSRFITLFQAAAKSLTNFFSPSELA